MLLSLVFWASSVIAVAATAMVLFSRNAFYAILYLILSLFGVALIFNCLGAPFLAVLEIIVYAGAIMVLFLFVVQMLSPGSSPSREEDMRSPTGAQLLLPGLMAGALLVFTLVALVQGTPQGTGAIRVISAREIGLSLFQQHYLGLELASLVLLIGIVGGMHLGRAGVTAVEEETHDAVR